MPGGHRGNRGTRLVSRSGGKAENSLESVRLASSMERRAGAAGGKTVFTSLAGGDPRAIGGYHLRARLGFGGMGQVYLSFTPGGRAVALKVVRHEYADDLDFRRRFAQEVRAAQRVSGRYTAQLLDAGPDADTPWLATEYVPGPTLHQAVRDHGPMPHDAVRRLIAAAATSLQAIHGADVIHRDLTPRNLLLAEDGPRIIDFGIARAVDATHLTLSHTPIGTPSFMAPEQAAGEQVTPATDLFTLGTLAYFAATGHTAFGDGNYLSVLRRVADVQADLTDCPAELRELVESCLRREPAERPTTTEVVQMCGGAPRFSPDWLSRPVRAEITARRAALAALLAEPPGPNPSSSPPNQAARPGPYQAARPGPFQPSPPLAGPTHTIPPTAGPPRAVAPPSGVAGPTTAAGGRTPSRRLALVAVAAALVLVGAIAGVAITSRLVDGKGTSGTGRTADAGRGTGPASASPQGGAQPTPASSAPTGTPTPAVRWSGRIRITYRGIDIDQVPPVTAPSKRSDSDFGFGSYPDDEYGINDTDPNYAKWPGPGSPSPSACGNLISTEGLSAVMIVPRDVVCVRTSEQRIAALTITSAVKEFSDGVMANVTVWDTTPGS
ncbi:protein kinase [Micromonospora fulviviridis]|uniref:serine/threonine-protein kinase n=1 Tax=Micromonospora fulviviridis TaxID=47860 RepID=UPI00378F8667